MDRLVLIYLKSSRAALAGSLVWCALSVPVLLITPDMATASGLSKQLSASDRKIYSRAFADFKKGHWQRGKNRMRRGQAALPKKIAHWLEMTTRHNIVPFGDIAAFIDANPDWPRQGRLKRNAERAMEDATLSPSETIAWLGRFPPQTTEGRIRLAEAMLAAGETEEAITMLRDIWREGNFPRAGERRFYRTYRKMLTRADHEARLDNLLWRNSRGQARRMLSRVSTGARREAEARISLRRMRGGVDGAIARTPPERRVTPGFLYERLRWRRRKNRTDDALEILTLPPAALGRAGLWALERMVLARRLLSDGRAEDAWKAMRDHRVTASEDRAAYAEAEWMTGWIELRFMKRPQEALLRFLKLHREVNFPVSKARAAFWAGKAAQALKDHELEKSWLRRAAAHWTTYHGQLARHELATNEQPRMKATVLPAPGPGETPFLRSELARAVMVLTEIGEHRLARRFLLHIVRAGTSTDMLAQAVNLTRIMNRPDLGVWVSRRALRNGHIVLQAGYPLYPVPQGGVEAALLRSIARQESNFDPSVRSWAGALGVMQLMPATARSTARMMGIRYHRRRLTTDPAYNVRIGKAYIEHLIRQFNGSYILAIAGYNAGPHAVKRWLRKNGDPRKGDIDPVDWIELIPYSETRTYVQRVLGNLQVFRRQEAKGPVSVTLKTDLTR